MFQKKNDRLIIETTIEFNLRAIEEWLLGGGEKDAIASLDRNWSNAVIQEYIIDVLPIGERSDAYHHRSKGVISQNIEGADFLDNTSESVKHIAQRAKVQKLEWRWWRDSISLIVNDTLVLSTPSLTEVIELQTTGKISNYTPFKDEDKLQVVITFDDKGNPEEYMDTWRSVSLNQKSVSYGNALARISFSASNLQVLY